MQQVSGYTTEVVKTPKNKKSKPPGTMHCHPRTYYNIHMVVRRSPPSGPPVLSCFAVMSYTIIGVMAIMLFYGPSDQVSDASCGGAFNKVDGAEFG